MNTILQGPYIILGNSEGPDQTVQLHSIFIVFTICIWKLLLLFSKNLGFPMKIGFSHNMRYLHFSEWYEEWEKEVQSQFWRPWSEEF